MGAVSTVAGLVDATVNASVDWESVLALSVSGDIGRVGASAWFTSDGSASAISSLAAWGGRDRRSSVLTGFSSSSSGLGGSEDMLEEDMRAVSDDLELGSNGRERRRSFCRLFWNQTLMCQHHARIERCGETYLDFFLTQGDFSNYFHTGGLVWLRVAQILCFEDVFVLFAVEHSSQYVALQVWRAPGRVWGKCRAGWLEGGTVGRVHGGP